MPMSLPRIAGEIFPVRWPVIINGSNSPRSRQKPNDIFRKSRKSATPLLNRAFTSAGSASSWPSLCLTRCQWVTEARVSAAMTCGHLGIGAKPDARGDEASMGEQISIILRIADEPRRAVGLSRSAVFRTSLYKNGDTDGKIWLLAEAIEPCQHCMRKNR